MNKLVKILFFSIPLLVVIVFFLPFDAVWEYIKVFSVDKEIKTSTKTYGLTYQINEDPIIKLRSKDKGLWAA